MPNRLPHAWIIQQPNQHMVLMTTNGGAGLVSQPHRFSNEENMKIEIKRSTICGGMAVSAGDIVDASDFDARSLIAIGKAIPAPEKAKKPQNRDKQKRSSR